MPTYSDNKLRLTPVGCGGTIAAELKEWPS
jgi:hypothetical protein